MRLQKKKVMNWVIVSSVIALLILAYLLVAIPREGLQNITESPFTGNMNTGDLENIEKTENDDKGNSQSDTELEQTVSTQDDEDTNDASDEFDDTTSDDNDDQGDDDSDDNTDSDNDYEDGCPPMKWGLNKASHNDSASDNADEHRGTCNGKAVGNPFHLGEKQKPGNDHGGSN